MAKKLDVEIFLDGIKDILILKLNAKLTALDAEKNDGIVLPQLDADAFEFQAPNERVLNYNPFVIYGVDDLGTIELDSGSASDISASVIISLCENGLSNIDRIMMRYSRALKEVIEENFKSIGRGLKLSVSQAMPISFKLLGSDESYKAVGINISVVII